MSQDAQLRSTHFVGEIRDNVLYITPIGVEDGEKTVTSFKLGVDAETARDPEAFARGILALLDTQVEAAITREHQRSSREAKG